MPTYEYACSSCGTHVEVVQRFNDEPLTQCGVCGGALRKVFHPAGILFKGSGFYKTDSRSGRTPAAAKAGEPGSKESGSKESSSGTGSSTGTSKVADGGTGGRPSSPEKSTAGGKEQSA
ncbi:MAG TPA: FmdB family zinc ribbon protein [Actinomycetota bacterium]